MKTGTVSKAYQGPAIHQRYFTPSEALIPTLSYLQKHEPISIINYKKQKTAEVKIWCSLLSIFVTSTSTKITDEGILDELDGFLLLETTGSEFPEDAQQVMLVDKHLASVVEVGASLSKFITYCHIMVFFSGRLALFHWTYHCRRFRELPRIGIFWSTTCPPRFTNCMQSNKRNKWT